MGVGFETIELLLSKPKHSIMPEYSNRCKKHGDVAMVKLELGYLSLGYRWNHVTIIIYFQFIMYYNDYYWLVVSNIFLFPYIGNNHPN